MISKKRILLVACCLSLVIVCGCSPISITEEQKKQLISADPVFEKTLEAKAEFDSQIAELRARFSGEKSIYESKAAMLRREFEARRAQFYSDVNQIKSYLSPQRKKIKVEFDIVTEDYKNKLRNQKAVRDMLNQAKSIVDGKISATLSPKDKDEWRKRYDSLSQEYDTITREVSLLKEKLYILKLKQRSLIQ